MQRFSTFDIDELKRVYRILHDNLLSDMDLMDTDFLEALQRWLQYRASQDGVDVTDHSLWDAWLNGKTAVSAAPQTGMGRVIPLTIGKTP